MYFNWDFVLVFRNEFILFQSLFFLSNSFLLFMLFESIWDAKRMNETKKKNNSEVGCTLKCVIERPAPTWNDSVITYTVQTEKKGSKFTELELNWIFRKFVIHCEWKNIFFQPNQSVRERERAREREWEQWRFILACLIASATSIALNSTMSFG